MDLNELKEKSVFPIGGENTQYAQFLTVQAI